MAIAEAAGWLAHAHAWVHPLDLALRDAGLTAQHRARRGRRRCTAPAADLRRSRRRRADWADPPFEAMADGDRAIADALALARLLAGCPAGPRPDPFATPAAAAATLAALGAGGLDPRALPPGGRRTRRSPVAAAPIRHARAGEGSDRPCRRCSRRRRRRPGLDGGRHHRAPRPAPRAARRHRPGRPRRDRPAPSSCRSGRPIRPSGFGDRDALPGLRSDAADRLVGRGRPVTWPLAFLHLVAESARMGLRELDRLEAVAEQGRGLVAGGDKRSRLPDALDALLRVPALTPKALAARLRIAPQTGTALLRELQGKGVVREVTGRGSFRAFAI